jgi:vibriolysin
MSIVVDTYHFGALSFSLLRITSDCAQHPTTTLTAPLGAVVLGGGAYVDWHSAPCSPASPAGNLLTAMYPNDNGTAWTVASKDHEIASKATVTAYCIVAHMRDGTPITPENYRVVSATSAGAAHPTMQVNVPDGFIVVGGGARTNWAGAGSLLFASYPTADLRGWVGSGKDHDVSDPATITVWAIGLKESFLRRNRMVVRLSEMTSSPPTNHPRVTYVVNDFNLTGVGARVNWDGAGNLLTASFPQDRQTVVAEAKDHRVADPSTITAYAIGFGSA